VLYNIYGEAGGGNMKKTVIFILILMMAAMGIFAQSYIVDEVSGSVTIDTGGGKLEQIKVGDKLTADTIIRTGIGASLKVKLDELTLIVGSAKNGRLGDLAGSSTGIQIQGRVSQTDTTVLNRTSSSAVTASARGSDEAADLEVAEE